MISSNTYKALEIFDNVLRSVCESVDRYYVENNIENKNVFKVLRSGLDAVNFVSGDADFNGFQTILEAASIAKYNCFVDLGCGSGHCIAAAAMFHLNENRKRFDKIVGVELKQSKVVECNIMASKIVENCTDWDMPETVVHHANFLDVDWSCGTVVYACATCFTESLMTQLTVKFMELQSGSRVILLDKQLASEYVKNKDSLESQSGGVFQLLNTIECKTSWGKGIAYIYNKL